MDIKFDVSAAERLLQQMDVYCSAIQRNAKDLLATLNNSSEWNDNQMKAFQANINNLAKDLNQALILEGEYMLTFYQRVREFRG